MNSSAFPPASHCKQLKCKITGRKDREFIEEELTQKPVKSSLILMEYNQLKKHHINTKTSSGYKSC